MKKFYLAILLLTALFTGTSAFASHEMGVDITYQCLNACTTRIYLKAYRDCTGSNAIGNNLTWSAPGCTPPNAINAWSPQFNAEVTPICPGSATASPDDFQDGVLRQSRSDPPER